MVQNDERVGQGNLNDSTSVFKSFQKRYAIFCFVNFEILRIVHFWGFVYMMKKEYLCSVIKRNVKPLKSKSYENYSRKVKRVVCFEERRY